MNRPRDCQTCAKRETCDLGCTGYVEAAEVREEREAYEERQADIRREEERIG